MTINSNHNLFLGCPYTPITEMIKVLQAVSRAVNCCE